MKKYLLLALFTLPMLASAQTNETEALTKRMAELERALRLQTLTTQAIRQDNYDLACKAQKEATDATHKADVVDLEWQSTMSYAQICRYSRAIAPKETPSWLSPTVGSHFEPAGVYFEKN